VVLHNITPANCRADEHSEAGQRPCPGPAAIAHNNTLAAFQLIPQAVDPSAAYIGPALTPGQFGNQVFLYGPGCKSGISASPRRTKINERQSIEFRAQALNVIQPRELLPGAEQHR